MASRAPGPRGSVLLAFSAMMFATLLAALDQTIVVTALPRIASELNGFDGMSWVVTAYLVSSTVTIPLYGNLSDIYGRRGCSRSPSRCSRPDPRSAPCPAPSPR